MSSSNFILRQKIIDAMQHAFPIIDRFPKYEKFAMTTQIKNQYYNILKLSIEIQRYDNTLQTLKKLDTEVEYLRELIVFCNTKKNSLLSNQSRKSIMETLIEIGKIIGGLIKRS